MPLVTVSQHPTHLVVPRHARQQCHERIGPLNLRSVLSPYIPQLAAALPLKRRVAWFDAPGEMVPVLERSSATGPIVVVTILRRDYALSRETEAFYLQGAPALKVTRQQPLRPEVLLSQRRSPRRPSSQSWQGHGFKAQ
jgi:hypothetical protein